MPFLSSSLDELKQMPFFYQVDSLDLSRDLQLICVKSFVIGFYILHACVQTFDATDFRINFLDLNMA